MRLRHIEVFHAVYRSGSVSLAARELNVSQPSVSKVLKHAEDQLGFRLFRRIKGRLAPTDEAHALYREVKDVFERLGSLRLAANSLRDGETGHIRLAVLPALGLRVAPEAVARFRTAHPGVTFDLQTLHHAEVLRSLYARDCDMAVAYDPAEHPRLTSLKIGSGELGVLSPQNHSPPDGRLDIATVAAMDLSGPAARGRWGASSSARRSGAA